MASDDDVCVQGAEIRNYACPRGHTFYATRDLMISFDISGQRHATLALCPVCLVEVLNERCGGLVLLCKRTLRGGPEHE